MCVFLYNSFEKNIAFVYIYLHCTNISNFIVMITSDIDYLIPYLMQNRYLMLQYFDFIALDDI